MKPCILVIDDERNTREGLSEALADDYQILLAEDAKHGLDLLKKHHVDMVLTDLRMPGMDGMEFTKMVSSWDDAPLIIMLTAYGSVQTAMEAMKVGAYDYLTKPVNLATLDEMLHRGMETLAQRRQTTADNDAMGDIIGESKTMQAIKDAIRQVADTRTTVLLTGESGTGKEVFAQAIHRLSSRAAHPFVAVHCAALNENLLESELFGHERGAFTGAVERAIGRFESADGGTLFLDEIGEITLSTQVKLLRVLETRSFERVGGKETIQTDVRIVAATNRDLKAMVAAGTFREDLFFRLNVVNIVLPPLRERKEDIPLLLNHYLKRASTDNGKPVREFSAEAIEVLTSYAWPGNIRELRNCVESMVVFARGGILTLGDIPQNIRQELSRQFDPDAPQEPAAPAEVLDIKANEKNLILQALAECHGNRSQAAQKLKISRRTLHRKLNEYGL